VVKLGRLFRSKKLDRLRGLRIINGVASFELNQSIAVGCPLLEYLNLDTVRKVNGGENVGLSVLGQLSLLHRLRSLIIWLKYKPTECERDILLKALEKIIEEKGNVLENIFVYWYANNGSEVDHHFLFKVLSNCKNIHRIGYPCKFVFDNWMKGGEGQAAAVEQFLAAVDAKFVAAVAVTEEATTKFAQTNTNITTHPVADAEAASVKGKLTLELGTHESIQILRRRIMKQEEATAANHRWNNRIQWMDRDEWEKLDRALWNRMAKNSLTKPPSSRFYDV